MANSTGAKWTLGGAKRRNTLQINLNAFGELLTKLEGLEGSVEEAVTDAFIQAGETIGADTQDAVANANLPASGKYSRGNTESAVVTNPEMEWSGTIAQIGVGFDYSKPGAGGFLITGTPRMRPDYALQKIYTQKRYMNQIQKDMMEVVQVYIEKKMEG
jgi:hypothetical protein